MQRHVSVAHDNLAEQIDAVIKVLLLVCEGVRVVVVVGVVGLANLVHAVQRVEDVEGREVAALVVVQGDGGGVCFVEVFLLDAEIVVLIHSSALRRNQA